MALPTRPLGRTGLPVSVLGFGSVPVGDLYSRLDDGTAIATVEAALKGGITLYDTSPHYGNGLAEHRCGTAFRRVPRDSFVLSTKVGRVMDPRNRGPKVQGISPGFAGGCRTRPRSSIPTTARCDRSSSPCCASGRTAST